MRLPQVPCLKAMEEVQKPVMMPVRMPGRLTTCLKHLCTWMPLSTLEVDMPKCTSLSPGQGADAAGPGGGRGEGPVAALHLLLRHHDRKPRIL